MHPRREYLWTRQLHRRLVPLLYWLVPVITLLIAGLIVACEESPVEPTRLTMASAVTPGVSFVQGTANSTTAKTIAIPLTAATTKGNLVIVGFDFASTTFTSISDNQGNVFTQVGTEVTSPGGAKTRLYYARNIAGGSETISINLAATTSFLEVYVAEYTGADPANPLDVSAQNSGSSSSVTSGNATTTSLNDLLVAICIGDSNCSAGSGFTARSTFHSNLLEDRAVTTTGAYAATASASKGWAIIMAALRPGSTAPPAPVASVTVAPATASVIVGQTVSLTDTTKDASGNVLTGRAVTWTTSNAALATVSATGVVTAVAIGGPVTITATSEGQTGTATITVTAVPVATVTVAPATGSVITGQTLPLTVTTKDANGNVLTGRVISWTTSNATLATVSAAGVVSGVAAGGPVTITATCEGHNGTAAITVIVPPVASVTVTPVTSTVLAGQTDTLTATTKDAGGNVLTGRTVTWTTGNAAIATVSTAGVVTGVAGGGPVTITATSEGQSGTAAVTVTLVPVASVTVVPAAATVLVGQTTALADTTKDADGNVLTGRPVTWSTSNAALATVSAAGVVTGVAAGGPVTITASSEGQTGSAAITVALPPVASVAVTPASTSVAVGLTVPLTATPKDASGNALSGREIVWATSDATLATVSTTGVVTGVALGGPVTISATSEGQSGSAAVTVTPVPVASVTVAPPTASVIVGQTVPLDATTKDAGGNPLTGRSITWTTSNAALATVSATGVVTGVGAGGPVTITATSEGQSGKATITVTPVPVASLTVAPTSAEVFVGQTVPLVATPSDAAGNPLTGRVITWTTDNATLATVSAGGVVSGLAAGGPVTITATCEGQSSSSAITVSLAPVATVSVAPASASVFAGQSVTLIATPKDAVGNALAGRVISWASSDPTVAPVGPSGVVTGAAAGGPVTITASSEGQSGTATVTVAVTSPTGYVYPLRVGPTSRYLVDQLGKPFMMVGDAAWSLIAQLSDQDADSYFASRQQNGFDLALVNVLEHKFASHAPADIYNIKPFTGANFTTPNPDYFAHVDYIIQSAAQKGIVVLLAPAYVGYGCGNEGWAAELKAATDADLTAWGRFLGARYAGYDNIMWVIGADANPTTCGVKTRLQALVNGIQQYDTRHLFTAHNAPESMAISTWSGVNWLTVNNVYTNSSSLYSRDLTAYQVTPTMPYFLIETAYENEHSSTAQTLRAQIYWTMLSGGFGQIFGNCPMWFFSAPAGSSFCSATAWQNQLNSTGTTNMKYAQKLFGERNWHLLVPDQAHAVLTAGFGSGSTYSTAAAASDGSSIIAYLPSSRTVTVNGSRLGSSMTAWWYKPATGTSTMIGTFTTAARKTFTPPSSGDWVLVLDNPNFNFSPP